jgi:hypothetical protein
MDRGENMSFYDLNANRQSLLSQYGGILVDKTWSGTVEDACVFALEGDELHFISDYVLTNAGGLIKCGQGPELGLYCGGGSLKLKTDMGDCVFYGPYDDQLYLSNWMASFSEGEDLTKTVTRRGFCEFFPVALARGQEFLLSPDGTNK